VSATAWTLVVGSGGVKSVAALGVAEVLADAGLQPSAIAGTSAGAVFGGLLAMGQRPKEAMQTAQQLWSRDITKRRRTQAWFDLAGATVGVKRRADREFGDHFALRCDAQIVARIQAAFGTVTIESLATPLSVHATDARSGQAVVLSKGPLWQALRASVALPFLFAPFTVNGQPLVDGSVSNPLPMNAVLPGHATVAVGFDVPLPRRVDGPTRMATRITASLTNNLMQAQVQQHQGARTVVLMPQLTQRVGLFDTDAMPYLIELGRQTARAALPAIERALSAPAAMPTVAWRRVGEGRDDVGHQAAVHDLRPLMPRTSSPRAVGV
jgi:NTE family protein